MKEIHIQLDYNKFKRHLAEHIEENMMNVCARLVGIVKEKLNVSGAGTPSAEGMPPHKQTGDLINSITYKVVREGDNVVGVYGVRKGPGGQGDPDQYARRLELGFVGVDSLGRNINQAPRPYLVPAYFENQDKIIKWLRG